MGSGNQWRYGHQSKVRCTLGFESGRMPRGEATGDGLGHRPAVCVDTSASPGPCALQMQQSGVYIFVRRGSWVRSHGSGRKPPRRERPHRNTLERDRCNIPGEVGHVEHAQVVANGRAVYRSG